MRLSRGNTCDERKGKHLLVLELDIVAFDRGAVGNRVSRRRRSQIDDRFAADAQAISQGISRALGGGSAASLPKSKTTIITTTPAPSNDEAEPEEASAMPATPIQCTPTPHRYNIQVDAAIDKPTADEMVHRIGSLGYRACEKPVLVNGQRQYAVRIGPYNTADEAATAQERLHEQYKEEYSEP